MDAERLKSVPLFESLPDDVRDKFAVWVGELKVDEGRHLADQGDYAYELFVIEDGTAEVFQNGNRIAELGPGEFFGELSLFDAGPRSATVIATEDTETVVLSHAAVLQLVQRHPEVATAFLKALCRRLRTVDNRLENAARTQEPTASSDQP